MHKNGQIFISIACQCSIQSDGILVVLKIFWGGRVKLVRGFFKGISNGGKDLLKDSLPIINDPPLQGNVVYVLYSWFLMDSNLMDINEAQDKLNMNAPEFFTIQRGPVIGMQRFIWPY